MKFNIGDIITSTVEKEDVAFSTETTLLILYVFSDNSIVGLVLSDMVSSEEQTSVTFARAGYWNLQHRNWQRIDTVEKLSQASTAIYKCVEKYNPNTHYDGIIL